MINKTIKRTKSTEIKNPINRLRPNGPQKSEVTK